MRLKLKDMREDDGGAGRAAVVVLLVLLIVVAVGVFLWIRYTGTPQYASLKAVQAVSARDYPMFAQWVDVDGVVRTVVQKQAGSQLPAGVQLPQAMQDAAVAQAKGQVESRITAGVPGIPANVPFVALYFGAPVTVNSNDGSKARVTVSAEGRSIDLVLRRDADHWRVSDVPDAAQLMGQLGR